MVGQISGRTLTLVTIGYIRWSTHEAPEKAKGDWQTPKEQTLSEVSQIPSSADSKGSADIGQAPPQ